MVEKKVILTVKSLDPNLVGKKIATIDNETKTLLDLTNEDLILIKGKGETLAKVWPGRATEDGKKIVRIDLPTRNKLGIGLNDTVTIIKADFEVLNQLAEKYTNYKTKEELAELQRQFFKQEISEEEFIKQKKRLIAEIELLGIDKL
jgi:hypothetical protein